MMRTCYHCIADRIAVMQLGERMKFIIRALVVIAVGMFCAPSHAEEVLNAALARWHAVPCANFAISGVSFAECFESDTSGLLDGNLNFGSKSFDANLLTENQVLVINVGAIRKGLSTYAFQGIPGNGVNHIAGCLKDGSKRYSVASFECRVKFTIQTLISQRRARGPGNEVVVIRKYSITESPYDFYYSVQLGGKEDPIDKNRFAYMITMTILLKNASDNENTIDGLIQKIRFDASQAIQ